MRLPQSIIECIRTLEAASFSCYAVGGCVRDWLLGLTPQDFDLCTDATPEQMQAVFSHRKLALYGVKHGTVGVIIDDEVVEITTFRTEGSYTDNRHPDWVQFVSDIESDLARRDFTVNAMAYSPSRGLCDPFGGQADLKNKTLRAVGDPDTRFQEDALRILRGIRFAARYGLSIEPNTWDAMLQQLPLTDHLARERVMAELTKLLLWADGQALLNFSPVITYVIPELAPAVGFDQHSPHHAYPLYTHIAYVTGAVPATAELRWAGLLHDSGKVATFTQGEDGRGHFYGHAKESAAIADTVLRRLKAPTAQREMVMWLVENHMTPLDPDLKLLRRRISHYGPEAMLALIDLQEADTASKGPDKPARQAHFQQLRQMVQQILEESTCLGLSHLALKGDDLIRAGFTPGKSFSLCLHHLLDQVINEQLPNEHTALLAAAKIYLTQIPEEIQ